MRRTGKWLSAAVALMMLTAQPALARFGSGSSHFGGG